MMFSSMLRFVGGIMMQWNTKPISQNPLRCLVNDINHDAWRIIFPSIPPRHISLHSQWCFYHISLSHTFILLYSPPYYSIHYCLSILVRCICDTSLTLWEHLPSGWSWQENLHTLPSCLFKHLAFKIFFWHAGISQITWAWNMLYWNNTRQKDLVIFILHG